MELSPLCYVQTSTGHTASQGTVRLPLGGAANGEVDLPEGALSLLDPVRFSPVRSLSLFSKTASPVAGRTSRKAGSFVATAGHPGRGSKNSPPSRRSALAHREQEDRFYLVRLQREKAEEGEGQSLGRARLAVRDAPARFPRNPRSRPPSRAQPGAVTGPL